MSPLFLVFDTSRNLELNTNSRIALLSREIQHIRLFELTQIVFLQLLLLLVVFAQQMHDP